MTDSETLRDIAFDALRQMYDEAEPPLDFDDALENPDDYDEGWYNDHVLDEDRQHEIVYDLCDEHGISDNQRFPIYMMAVVNYGPASE